jgi:LysR family glycine cleavage system transcriptional activator
MALSSQGFSIAEVDLSERMHWCNAEYLSAASEIFYIVIMTRLPPLNALRAFEAVARHASMAEAARDLGVTPGAVSQQIALLEHRLDVKLFHRLHHALELTEAGRVFLPHVRGAFRQIGEAVQRLSALSGAQILTLSSPPAFAAAWLVPRLGAFQARHPAIDLRLSTGRTLVDFEAGGADAAIRHGLGRWKGLHADRIVSAALVPVCAPGVLLGREPPRQPLDMAHLPLLHDGRRQDWAFWFQAHGIQPLPPSAFSGPSFDDQTLLIRAAASSQGVALVTEALARAELSAGVLVRALDIAWPQDFAYWLVCPRADAERAKIVALRDWLLAEASRDNAEDDADPRERGADAGRSADVSG